MVFLRLDMLRWLRDTVCMRRSSKPLPKDPNQLACEIVRMSTQESEVSVERSPISAYLSEIGRNGGLKGGHARARKLSKERRIAIARRAALMRWKKNARKSLP